MNVIIFGASGGIGKQAVMYALQKGHHVTAYLRSPGKLDMSHENLSVVKGEISDYEAVAKAMRGQDAVIWCVGIPLKRKYARMESLEGHKILIKAMRECDVSRLIDWATPSVPFHQDKKSFITTVPGIIAGVFLKKAKQEMIEIGKLVQGSGLKWTIVRFMAPKDAPPRGGVKIGFGDTKMKFAVSRSDIAAFMVGQLECEKYLHSMPIIGS